MRNMMCTELRNGFISSFNYPSRRALTTVHVVGDAALTGAVHFAATLMALCFLTLTGCKPAQPIVPETLLPDTIDNVAPLPEYSELIERYNATTAPLVRVWAEAHVDLVWLDEKGKRKSEHGDGRFMYVAPDKVALEIQEFGKGFWAGSDGERYWLFDLQDQRIVYVGRFDLLDQLDEGVFPLPVLPTDLLYVLGLVPIDPDRIPDAPAVELVNGYYLIEPPGLGLRMLLNPESARPLRVDLLDQEGNSAVKCVLSKPAKLERSPDMEGLPTPVMPSVVEVYVLNEEARMTLKLKALTTEGRRIRDSHFDFDTLKKVYKPDQVVDLDAPMAEADMP